MIYVFLLVVGDYDTSFLDLRLVPDEVGTIVTRPETRGITRFRRPAVADERTVLELLSCRSCIHVEKPRVEDGGRGWDWERGAERLAASSCSRVLYENPVVRPSHPPEKHNFHSLCSVSPRASRVFSSHLL